MGWFHHFLGGEASRSGNLNIFAGDHMKASLPSGQLDAFIAIAKTESFSKATNLLHITQSALSQKIKLLEENLRLTLFIRTPTGVRLTEQGEKLLRYCQVKESLENELLQELSLSNEGVLSGVVRIGCYSSVFRSAVIPTLAPFLKLHPQVKVEFTCATIHQLPEKLQRAEIDFMILDHKLDRQNLEARQLGHEKYVVITSSKTKSVSSVFLDNNADDTATTEFFKVQKKAPKFTRAYFGDCYGIIDGVKNGLGSAVMPEHLVKNLASIAIVDNYKPVTFDVVLHFHKQPIYSKLHQALVTHIVDNCPKYLSSDSRSRS